MPSPWARVHIKGDRDGGPGFTRDAGARRSRGFSILRNTMFSELFKGKALAPARARANACAAGARIRPGDFRYAETMRHNRSIRVHACAGVRERRQKKSPRPLGYVGTHVLLFSCRFHMRLTRIAFGLPVCPCGQNRVTAIRARIVSHGIGDYQNDQYACAYAYC